MYASQIKIFVPVSLVSLGIFVSLRFRVDGYLCTINTVVASLYCIAGYLCTWCIFGVFDIFVSADDTISFSRPLACAYNSYKYDYNTR